MKATYCERLCAGLTADGWTEVKGRSHYREFSRQGWRDKLFVGPAGALRKGECASRSVSIGDPVRQTEEYKRVLAEGDKVLGTSAKKTLQEFTA